jgi:hypothetical protein
MIAEGGRMQSKLPTGRDRRAAKRYPVYATLRVYRPDSIQAVSARITNISDTGAAVESGVPLAFGSLVHLELRRFRLYGSAHVVRCRTKLAGYMAALQFQGPLVGDGGIAS